MTDIIFFSTPGDAQVSLIEYSPSFSTQCTIGKAPFHGTLQIIFHPTNELLEFESFEAWLLDRANESYTIESFTRLVYDALTDHLGDLTVVCRASTTKHADVVCIISDEV